MAQPTAKDQEMLELVNRMRQNPAGELDLLLNSADPKINQALNFFQVNREVLRQQWQQLQPTAPVAWSNELDQAASTHNQLMIANDLQSHNLPGEVGLIQRNVNAGYTGGNRFAENVYAFSDSVEFGHASMAIDWGSGPNGIQNPAGHRDALLSPLYREVGIAIDDEANPNTTVGPSVVTQEFANRTALNGKAWLLGVAFADSNGNKFYNAGEGVKDLTVRVTKTNSDLVTNVQTADAGGYQVLLDPGAYQLQFLRGAEVLDTQSFSIDTTNPTNIKRDIVVGTTPVATPPAPVAPAPAVTPVAVNPSATPTPVVAAIDPAPEVPPVVVTPAPMPVATPEVPPVVATPAPVPVATPTPEVPPVVATPTPVPVLTPAPEVPPVVATPAPVPVATPAPEVPPVVATPTPVTVATPAPEVPPVVATPAPVQATENADRLEGTSSNDTIRGLGGDDTISGGAGDDRLYGNNGNDYLAGSFGRDRLYGNDGNDTLFGEQDDDLLRGGNGNDRLWGNDGNDTLLGGNGRDRLVGNAGDDLLVGGGGSDLFVLESFRPFQAADFGLDTIDDFQSGRDKIQLGGAGFAALQSVFGNGFSQAGEFAAVADDNVVACSAAAIVYSQNSGKLFYNANGSADGLGDGAAIAQITGKPGITANDFILAPHTTL
jgi:RTX calcium-binding nonapeptide repeat (4 copies)/Cysteine-rich secretory protein family